jgi:Flp pilus assembly protein TadG
MVAGSLLLLMGLAAIALDGGMGFSEKRQAQAAVDFGALAALQGATSCPSPCTSAAAANAGAAEAMTVVAANLPGRTLTWASCTDPAKPAKFTIVAASTPCVSFTSNFSEARVRLPSDAMATSFGRVVGRNTITVRAEAQAGQSSQATSSIVPFAFGGGTLTCLYSNQAPQTVPPCNGPNNGNFGYLDIMQYGNVDLGTTADCTNGGALARLASNIALGSDHILGTWSSGSPIVNDLAACPNRSESPNEIQVQTGAPSDPITSGLVTNANARLLCTGSGACTTVRSRSLNNQPLWAYLMPGKCGGPSNRNQMLSCLNNWVSGDGVIFKSTIADEHRFVAVPEFSSYPAGAGNYKIVSFRMVYLETIYADCNANACNTVFSPGEASTGACPSPLDVAVASCGFSPGTWSGGKRVEGLTGFVLKPGMVPPSVSDFFAGQPGVRIFNLTK